MTQRAIVLRAIINLQDFRARAVPWQFALHIKNYPLTFAPFTTLIKIISFMNNFSCFPAKISLRKMMYMLEKIDTYTSFRR